MGSALSEFLMQFLLGTAFITIYSVLFIRKQSLPTSPSNSMKNSSSKNSFQTKSSNQSKGDSSNMEAFNMESVSSKEAQSKTGEESAEVDESV
jgi:hypothetical protein